jgi:hypothetical protein
MNEIPKKPSRYVEGRLRLITESFNTPREDREHLYMPVALAHVYFPRRDQEPKTNDPNPNIKRGQSWKTDCGDYSMRIKQISVENPRTGEDQFLGVPYGPTSRLLLAHINTLALKQGSNKIDIEADTLPQFLKNMKTVKDRDQDRKIKVDGGNQLSQARNQIARLASSIISISYRQEDGSSLQTNVPIVKGFDLFPQTHPEQLLLWKRHIVLTLDYWEELQKHPLPLAKEHLMILSANARAIDFYTYLAYRLHHLKKPLFLTWATMKQLFGGDIEQMFHFKAKMRQTAQMVKLAYTDARFSCNSEGWIFEKSPSPIAQKYFPVKS